jgi:chromate transporter
MIGDRFQGFRGALACLTALMAGPLAVLIVLALSYDRLAGLPAVRCALAGSASAAAGLIMGTALRILAGVKLTPWALVCVACAFGAVGIFRAPLPWVVATLAPLSIAGAAFVGRRP